MSDTRYVYSAGCTWNESISEVAKTGAGGLPCCPHCGSVLFELPNEAKWFGGAAKHDKTHEGYLEFIKWVRGKCFTGAEMEGLRKALKAYEEETGKTAEL